MNLAMFNAVALGLAAVLSAWAGMLAYRANREKNRNDREQGAGMMALELARSLRAELDAAKGRLEGVERWQRTVRDDWWPPHLKRDEMIADELDKLDPGIRDRLPPLEDLPA